MATIGVMGPIQGSKTLGPGDSVWVDFGEADGFASCALSASATAHTGTGGTAHVLKTDDVNLTTIETPHGDLPSFSFHAGCNVTNTGQTTISSWSVLVGVIVP